MHNIFTNKKIFYIKNFKICSKILKNFDHQEDKILYFWNPRDVLIPKMFSFSLDNLIWIFIS